MENKKSMEHTSLLVLSLLSTGDMYGYQMILELEKRSDNTFLLKEGTLYPVLKKLENAGYLKTYTEDFGGRTRKYYHITDSGTALLKKEAAAWKRYAHGIDAVLGGAIMPV